MTRDWDKHLGNILASLDGDDAIDDEDRSVEAVLITLRRAVQGEFPLLALAFACICFDHTHATTEARK